MRPNSTCAIRIRRAITNRIVEYRREQQLSKTKYSQMLMMSYRSYWNLENASAECGMLTLLFYLSFCVEDAGSEIACIRPMIIQALEDDEDGHWPYIARLFPIVRINA